MRRTKAPEATFLLLLMVPLLALGACQPEKEAVGDDAAPAATAAPALAPAAGASGAPDSHEPATAPSPASSEAAARSPASPDPAAAASPVEEPVLWVDVRTPAEFAAGHVRGAVNIPYDQMESRWREIAEHRDRPVALYCRTGRRSGIALQVLEAKGFTVATDEGDFEGVAARGVPVVRR